MGRLHVQLTAKGWLLAVLGATMLAACVILIKAGMNRISAQEASILCVLEPIVSLVAGALILHEIISVKAAVQDQIGIDHRRGVGHLFSRANHSKKSLKR